MQQPLITCCRECQAKDSEPVAEKLLDMAESKISPTQLPPILVENQVTDVRAIQGYSNFESQVGVFVTLIWHRTN